MRYHAPARHHDAIGRTRTAATPAPCDHRAAIELVAVRSAAVVSAPALFAAALFAAALLAAALLAAAPAAAQGLGVYDPAPAWPMCGRILDNPPMGWMLGMDCPPERFGDPAFHDAPISSSFGPRQLPSEGFRYDFHRGIDLPADIGTPLFAIADGEVIKAGPHPSFDDPVIEIRHFRPGYGSCGAGGGCYSSMYLHVSGWEVMPGDPVSKGDYIGLSGESGSGFAHLHFEIRDAPPADPSSSWQKECVHPLGALPYPDSDADNIDLHLDSVDASDPTNPVVTVTATIPMGIELDLEGLEVEVYERGPGDMITPVDQPGAVRVGNTVEGDGYAVNPPFYSMNLWNRQYSYKDSGSGIAWEDFLVAGLYESPYAASLPPDYDPYFHLDAADPGDFQVGLFNGMTYAPIHSNDESDFYQVTFQFLELVGTDDAADLCVKVRALDALGNATDWQSWNCPVHSCPDVPVPGCRVGDKSKLGIKKKDGFVDKLKWSFAGGPATSLQDFAAPDEDDSVTWSWCLWDDSGSGSALAGLDIPAASDCGGKPCWKAAGTKGYRFKDRDGRPGGATGLKLGAGDVGRTRIKLKGKGANLPAVELPATVPLVAQLIADDGVEPVCWQADYATAKKNDSGSLAAK